MFNFFDWLQVEINPNLIVAEISYDNNVVVCDLNYTGYYARIYNCKHEGLLQGEKDKMAGVKNDPIKYRYPFQFFFSPITVVETFDYHSSCQPKTTRRAQTSMKVFCSEGFYLFWNFISIFVQFFCTKCFNLCSTQLFRTLMMKQFGFFILSQKKTNKQNKNQHPTTKEIVMSDLSFIIDFLCCIN